MHEPIRQGWWNEKNDLVFIDPRNSFGTFKGWRRATGPEVEAKERELEAQERQRLADLKRFARGAVFRPSQS